MEGKTICIPARSLISLALPLVAMILVLFGFGGGTGNAQVASKQEAQLVRQPQVDSASAAAPLATPAPGQDFQDVLPDNTFYSYLHNLFHAGIVSGYACQHGGSTDPCVPPANLPYYHPSVSVTRQQMTKFIDLGRRNIADAVGNSLYISTTAVINDAVANSLQINTRANIADAVANSLDVSTTAIISDVVANSLYITKTANIADAVGHSLYISTTAGIAGDFETRSGGEAVYAECLQSGNNCYALEGYAPTGDYALYAYGGKGAYLESDDTSQPAVNASAYGTGAYALHAESAGYRGGYVKSDSNSNYSLYVDSRDGPTQAVAALNVRGTIRGEGDLVIAGSKAGYVVDIMQNVGTEVLEPGDVVSIVGNSTPVLGQIPVVTVKKANSPYDTGVTGIVDEIMYAPDAATKAAYDKQEEELRSATAQRQQITADAEAKGIKPDLSGISMPSTSITDQQGTVHAIPGATQVPVNGYASVVTLGSYKAVKVDASFGPDPRGRHAGVQFARRVCHESH